MPYTVQELKPNVYHISDPFNVFMTLVVGENKALLFDTGYGIDRLDETVRQITPLPLIVVNSHGHVDHVLGNYRFDPVYLHPADLSLYQRHSSQGYKHSVTTQRKARPEIFPPDFSAKAYLAKRTTHMLPVQEGDVFDLGGVRLSVVHIPGHTPGSIALLDDCDRLLLAGDSVSLHIWMFLRESMTMGTYIQSLEKLQGMQTQFDAIVASHMPALLPKALLARLIHCAGHIDPHKSVPYASPFAGQALLYCEGMAELARSLGKETIDFATQSFSSIDLGAIDVEKVPFVSIAYSDAKL
jgi:glyoxylase-like metal-dependent hydrolase (beta-lactamase superfamily II)